MISYSLESPLFTFPLYYRQLFHVASQYWYTTVGYSTGQDRPLFKQERCALPPSMTRQYSTEAAIRQSTRLV